MSNTNRNLLLALTIVLAVAGLVLIGWGLFLAGQQSVTPAATADITVMPCSAWANDANPTIPEHTLTDACVDERGTLHTAPASTAATN